MSVLLKPIKPKEFDVAAVNKALTDEAEAISKDVLLDYELTTATWNHKVKFIRLVQIGPTSIQILVGTNDEIWEFVNKGTRPHVIVPVRAKALRFQAGYKAKTTPGIIPSHTGGSFGNTVYSQGVFHPGSKARKFDETITKEWKKKMSQRLRRAMERARKVSGHAIEEAFMDKEKVEAKEEKQPEEKIAVKVIKQEGRAALVEYSYHGEWHRCSVNVKDLDGGTVALSKLQSGIEYGAEWAAVVSEALHEAGVRMAEELKARGIWTAEDVLRDISLVRAAEIQAVQGPIVKRLIQFSNSQRR